MALIPFPNQFVQINGLKIRYCMAGAGEPLILIHGLGAMMEYWYKNIAFLANHYQVIAFDLPGFGLSDKPNAIYDINYYVEFLNNFKKALGLEQTYILAHSLGGGLALRYAQLYTSQVKKLILLNNVGFSTELDFGFRLLTIPYLGAKLMNATYKQFAFVLKKHVYDANSLNNEFIEFLYSVQKLPETKRVFLKIMSENVNIFGIKRKAIASIEENFAQLANLPIQIYWGKQDPILQFTAHTKEIKKFLPHAPLIAIDQCGHIPQIETPDFINQSVLDFLQ